MDFDLDTVPKDIYQLLKFEPTGQSFNDDDKEKTCQLKDELVKECEKVETNSIKIKSEENMDCFEMDYFQLFGSDYMQLHDTTDNVIHNNLDVCDVGADLVGSSILLLNQGESGTSQLHNEVEQENLTVQGHFKEELYDDTFSKTNYFKKIIPELCYNLGISDRTSCISSCNASGDKLMAHQAVKARNFGEFEKAVIGPSLANITEQDYKGNTAVHYIVLTESTFEKYQFLEILKKRSNLEHYQKLLKAACNVKNAKGDTPLHILTRSRDQQGIDKLLRLFRNPADIIDTQNSRKETCLYLACEVKDWRLVKYFLTNNADPNVGAMSGKKPIHFVCESNDLEMLRLLLKYGATPNQLFQGKNEKSLATCKEVKNACDVAMRKGRNERAKMKRKAQKEAIDMKIKKKK